MGKSPSKSPRLCPGVTLATRAHLVRNFLADSRFAGSDHFFDRVAITVTEVVGIKHATLFHLANSCDVRTRKIVDMDVIPNTGTIRCGVIIAK